MDPARVQGGVERENRSKHVQIGAADCCIENRLPGHLAWLNALVLGALGLRRQSGAVTWRLQVLIAVDFNPAHLRNGYPKCTQREDLGYTKGNCSCSCACDADPVTESQRKNEIISCQY